MVPEKNSKQMFVLGTSFINIKSISSTYYIKIIASGVLPLNLNRLIVKIS